MQHPVNILIVDEVAQYRTVLTVCLQRAGYRIAGACGHDQPAIEAVIGQDFPAIAFISFKTTKRDTLYTFEWLQTYFPDIRQVMTTLYASSCVQREADRLRVAGLIVKSFDLEQEIIQLLQSIHTPMTYR